MASTGTPQRDQVRLSRDDEPANAVAAATLYQNLLLYLMLSGVLGAIAFESVLARIVGDLPQRRRRANRMPSRLR
jgi:hypothetical protein